MKRIGWTIIEEGRQQLLLACDKLRSLQPWIQGVVDCQFVGRDKDLKRISNYLGQIITLDVPKALRTVNRGIMFTFHDDDFMSIQEGLQIISNSSGAAPYRKRIGDHRRVIGSNHP